MNIPPEKRAMGRPPGSLNKTSIGARLAMQAVFDGLGGVAAFKRWAQSNPDEYYKLYANKMIPTDVAVSGPNGGPIESTTTTRTPIVDPKIAAVIFNHNHDKNRNGTNGTAGKNGTACA